MFASCFDSFELEHEVESKKSPIRHPLLLSTKSKITPPTTNPSVTYDTLDLYGDYCYDRVSKSDIGDLMSVPSVEHQTGWGRPGPVAICQDQKVLKRVFLFDYDIGDAGFLDYCESRGTLNRLPELGSYAWTIITDHTRSRTDFISDTQFEYSHSGTFKYTESDLEAQWQCVRASRGALQDSWELYNG